MLKEIEAKRDLALRKRWKFKKPNGDIVVVRDVLEKMARWIYKFKETGDLIAQYDPAHLSLPWAAFRFFLQIFVSEAQLFGAMADDCKFRDGLFGSAQARGGQMGEGQANSMTQWKTLPGSSPVIANSSVFICVEQNLSWS